MLSVQQLEEAHPKWQRNVGGDDGDGGGDDDGGVYDAACPSVCDSLMG